MPKNKIIQSTLALIFLGLLLSACAGISREASSSEPIASYPKNLPLPIAPQPDYAVIVYESYIELLVGNIDRAAQKAVQMAAENGGYLASSQSWYTDGHKVTTLVLAVPTINFENLRRSVLGLGEMVNESVSGDLVQTQPQPGLAPYSHITLHLRPKSTFSLPTINPPWVESWSHL